MEQLLLNAREVLVSRRFCQISVLLVSVLIFAGPCVAQGKRVALVIGNSEYKHTPRLANPRNDAADMVAALGKLGFAVIEGRDLDKAGTDRKVRDFAQALSGADVGLFFYAGHGLQVGGQNYLVPVDAELTTASAIDFEMVRLDLVHRTMERETRTNILIMDACRDNPLARNLARALGTRSAQIGRGFAPVESGEGTLIGFSTQPGNVALDGTGRNSPYAAALLKHIATPGDDLPSILINVRNEVMQATGRRQVPWEHSALTARFYFIPPRTTAQQIELEFWASVKDSTTPAVLGTYLERYPSGEFAPIARALIEHYERQLKAELAAREEERKRQEEERRAAEVSRLEEERRAREAAIAEERKRAEEAKSLPDIKRLEEQAKAEWLARTEDLRKALEEARLAREAAKAAEEQRLAAVKSSEQATKAAEQTIATKREAEKTGDPTKLAALPKLEGGTRPPPYGGVQAGGLFTEADAKRVQLIAEERNLILPDFRFQVPNTDVPAPLRRFVGVWLEVEPMSSRKPMLIVTRVDKDGGADGYWAYGPPTPASFTKGPAGVHKVAGSITEGTLRFSIPSGTESFKLTLRSDNRLSYFWSHTSGRNWASTFSPVWTLVTAERAAKR